MKNPIIFTAAMMLCLCHVDAQPQTIVSASLEARFSQEFSTADHIKWFRAAPVTFAEFKYQDQLWLAYYDNEEQLVSTARKIRKTGDLPILVSRSLDDFRQRRGREMTLGAVYEWIYDGTARYLIILGSKQVTYTLTIDSMGGRRIVKKGRKAGSFRKTNTDTLIAKRFRR